MTQISIILAGFLSVMLLLQSAGISAQGAERGGEATAVRADEIASTAPPSSWIPPWFAKAPVLPPPRGAVVPVATVEGLLTAVDRVQPGGTILLAEGHYRLPPVMVLRDKKNVTLRSASANPARTILCGQGWDSQARGDDIPHIGRCEGSTIADLSFTDCRSYGIKVEAENALKDIHIYFVDSSSGNLALTLAADRAIDQAVPLPDVPEDIRRRSRALHPDLGAWEFEAGEPSTAGAAPATSLGNASVRYTVPDKPYVVLKHGGLEAVVVDNRAVDDTVLPGHRAGYHGIALLRHARQRRNLFVPAYAGLNFEDIHDGTVKPREVLFEPRHAPMELRVLNDRTADLYQAPTPYWGLESCMRYELLDDCMIELTFECVPHRDTFTNGCVGLFWASYIDRPESLDIHFRGFSRGAEANAGWLRGVTPAHGTLATHRASPVVAFHLDAGTPRVLLLFENLRVLAPCRRVFSTGVAVERAVPGDSNIGSSCGVD